MARNDARKREMARIKFHNHMILDFGSALVAREPMDVINAVCSAGVKPAKGVTRAKTREEFEQAHKELLDVLASIMAACELSSIMAEEKRPDRWAFDKAVEVMSASTTVRERMTRAGLI